MKKIIGLIIILGSFIWSLTIVKSGWKYSYGFGFWGANGHDAIWHIALSNNLAKFSFENPVFAGSSLQNYHIGFDLSLSLINKVTKIPISYLYFQILPPIFAILIGYLVYRFVLMWTGSIRYSLLSIIYTYFGGSMAWILGKGESAFWSAQAISTLINPPFVLSLIIILLGLISLLKKKTLFAILCFGILIQIKAYAAILVLGGLFFAGLFSFYIQHSKFYIHVFFGSLLFNLILAFIVPNNGLSTFKFQPFWYLETMMSYSDRLGWQRFYSAMTTYKMGDIYLKEIIAYGSAFLIFIVGNFWTRLVFLKDLFKRLDEVKIFLLIVVLGGIIIPTFFVQSGTPWNTIQFMYYSLFFSGILAGISLTQNIKYYIPYILVLLTVPTTYITLRDVYIPSRPPAKLSNYEFEGLSFLKSQSDGIVLTYPYDENKAKEAINNPPRPLYLYESTAYVSAYSQKTVFLEDEVNLNITGYDWKNRREVVLAWLKEKDEEKARYFLKDNNIKYIYWVKPQRALLGDKQLGLVKIFENEECIIFKYE